MGVALSDFRGLVLHDVQEPSGRANALAQTSLDAKLRENAELESYRPKLAEIERQLASLKQQLEIERKIVPDEKEVPGFMKMMNAEAAKAGVELRRYTAKPSRIEGFLHRSFPSKWNSTALTTRC